jgi:hypothetical protein
MSTTFQEFIDRSILETTRGLDAATVSLLDVTGMAENLVGQVFQDVAERLAAVERTRHLLRRTVSVTLSAGYGVLPDEVLSEYFCESTVNVANMSYVPWESFVLPQDFRLGYYTIKGSDGADRTLGWRNAGQAFADPLTKNGTVALTVPCVPAIPVTASGAILVPAEIISELQNTLAQRIRGQVDKDS